jgi:hypothetical protein
MILCPPAALRVDLDALAASLCRIVRYNITFNPEPQGTIACTRPGGFVARIIASPNVSGQRKEDADPLVDGTSFYDGLR